MFAGIIADIKFTQRAHNHEVTQIVYEREIDWLKSLRDNYKKCNSRWKPTEEQINALHAFVGMIHPDARYDAVLSMLNDLQKLL